ncbi:MAG: chemotaxis protein CheX, partial [Verrucomicrobiota bacterium]
LMYHTYGSSTWGSCQNGRMQATRSHSSVATPCSVPGGMSGSVVYTIDPELLGKVMRAWGENQPTEELLNDVVGEIANTIAGNAREELGSDFVISVPQILDGNAAVDVLSDGINIGIPVKVHGLDSQLYLTLKQN